MLFPRQEMKGDPDDEGAEDPGDETDDRVHASGTVDDLFALREAIAHFVDLFLMVRAQRPDGGYVALDLPQQCENLVDVVFVHKLLSLLSIRGM